ncbi:hypothetical protein ACRALDRAFT_2026876 [Sodiomyces alcalophilus JCM 7366]|uniref:uncharacterized protein n=1 Tax=Sodiomyces alcalophilus JCM 7366 TaxID=591952 RepID=UPI0039B368FA
MSTNKPGATPSSGTFMVVTFDPHIPIAQYPDLPPDITESQIVLNYQVDPRLAQDVTVAGRVWVYNPSVDKSPGASSWEPLPWGGPPGAGLEILRPRQGEGQLAHSSPAILEIGSLTPAVYGKDIALNLTWAFRQGTAEHQEGWSRSGSFVVDNGQVQRYPEPDETTQIETLPAALQEMIDAFNPPPTATNTDNLSPTGDATATKATTTSPNPTDLVDAPASASGGTGLSTGAIIGIAVGAGIAGLLLIGALVWFFCRRRRRRANGSGRDGSHGPEAVHPQHAANKETNLNVAESPHSPYSEDGIFPPQQLQSHQPNQTSEGAPLVDHVGATSASRSSNMVAPFSDFDSPAQSQPNGEPRADTRSATPNVAHLIEEGMTEEEIRRLEEEERALDDAIEAAQGRRTT